MTSSHGLRWVTLAIVSMFGPFAAGATSSGVSRDHASSTTLDYQPRSRAAWMMSRGVSGDPTSSTGLGYQPRSSAAWMISRGHSSDHAPSPARVHTMEAGPGAVTEGVR